MTDPDLTTLPDADLDDLRVRVLAEQERRIWLASAPGQVASIATRYAEDGGDVSDLTSAIAP